MNNLMKLLVATVVLAFSVETQAQVIDIIGDSTNSLTNVGANSSLGNGDYQLIPQDVDLTNNGGVVYNNIPNWFLAGPGNEATVAHGQTNSTGPNNPQDGIAPAATNFVAFQFDSRLNVNDTAYNPNAGDSFSFGTYWNPNGPGAATTDTLLAGLYTSSVPVDANTAFADLTLVASTTLPVGNVEDYYTAPNFYTATGSEGPLFLGLTFNGASNTFSRTDLVSLSVQPAAIPEPSSITLLGLAGLAVVARRKRR